MTLDPLVGVLADLSTTAPPPTPVAPPGLQVMGDTFLSWLAWILRICGIGGLMACGVMMAIGRRNRSSMAADGAAGIPWVLGGLTLGAVATLLVAFILPG
jgi:hypothetical protein